MTTQRVTKHKLTKQRVTKQRKTALSALVLSLAFLLPGCIADTMNQKLPASDLRAGLRTVAATVNSSDKAEVLFYLENVGDAPLVYLPWNTPLEGELTADVFDVSIDGVSLDYQGILIKRVAPTESDYKTLEAGHSREVIVDLSASYDMSATGSYLIRLRTFGDQSVYTLGTRLGTAEASIVDGQVRLVRE